MSTVLIILIIIYGIISARLARCTIMNYRHYQFRSEKVLSILVIPFWPVLLAIKVLFPSAIATIMSMMDKKEMKNDGQ